MSEIKDTPPASVVMTTVALEDGIDPEWFCIALRTTGRLMVQDQDMNIGIMGTRKQLLEMSERIHRSVNACDPEMSLVDGVIGKNAQTDGHKEQAPER